MLPRHHGQHRTIRRPRKCAPWRTRSAICSLYVVVDDEIQDYLRDELRLSEPNDWKMLCSCAGWATINDTDAVDMCPATGRTRAQKQQLGALSKRLIDQSRVQALRVSGFADAKLVIYTDQSVENRVIVAANEGFRV